MGCLKQKTEHLVSTSRETKKYFNSFNTPKNMGVIAGANMMMLNNR